jgi:GTPase SAR1 family protein
MSIKQEFHLTVLGAAGVGKTSLMQRLSGKPFNRKAGHKPSIEEEAVQYSLEVATSDGLLLFHFYDWSYAEKRKNEDINRQLQRGSDGALFVYDVTEKRSKTDFYDFNDWYERAGKPNPIPNHILSLSIHRHYLTLILTRTLTHSGI